MQNSVAETVESTEVTCNRCQASCCRLEVLLISETGVPERYIATDRWGGQTMARLDDGWCAALNRQTMNCMIYAQRPQICRDFKMGGHECRVEFTTG
ncbi:MAG: YkgJ family cysteine cluster protein [Gammaproteobacteria bacterium]|nr:YkgJ family cysteine cluster protein [Gammaproteobacteria bacterium]